MKELTLAFVALSLSITSLNVLSSEASEYCNDLYSADSYEPAERSQYIRECLVSYAGHDDGFSDVDDSDEGSFNGGVEDFVGSLDESELGEE